MRVAPAAASWPPGDAADSHGRWRGCGAAAAGPRRTQPRSLGCGSAALCSSRLCGSPALSGLNCYGSGRLKTDWFNANTRPISPMPRWGKDHCQNATGGRVLLRTCPRLISQRRPSGTGAGRRNQNGPRPVPGRSAGRAMRTGKTRLISRVRACCGRGPPALRFFARDFAAPSRRAGARELTPPAPPALAAGGGKRPSSAAALRRGLRVRCG